jgi:large subunit ribosomal protein L29
MHEMSKEAKPADLRAKTTDELQTLLLSLRKTQFNIRFQRATGQLEGLSQVRQVRRDIARVKTIIAQKKVTSSAASN